MSKLKTIYQLVKKANELDARGKTNLADKIDQLINKMAKMDPIGKEDEDINNDGKEDGQDKYLKNRRKKIQEKMKEKSKKKTPAKKLKKNNK